MGIKIERHYVDSCCIHIMIWSSADSLRYVFLDSNATYLYILCHEVGHGPLLLDRSVCLPLFAMWPSFGYFSTVI